MSRGPPLQLEPALGVAPAESNPARPSRPQEEEES